MAKMWNRTAGVVVVLVAGALLLALLTSPGVSASERDDAVAKRETAESEIEQIRSELVGIESDLAEVFLELEQVNLDLPVAEADLVQARLDLGEAEAEYAAAAEQLEAAEATQALLAEEIELSKQEEEDLQAAVGEMARELYRGNTSSPLQLVLTSEGTGDITERAATATTMTRAQTRALEDVRESLAVSRNQADRQEATTLRVSELEAETAEKQALAEQRELEVGQRVDELAELQDTLTSRQAAWNSRKGEAEEQLKKWESSRESAEARIAKIDKENREAQIRFEEEQAEQVVDPEPVTPDSSSRSSSSSTPSAETGMFGYPLPVGSASVTSNYGWRIHPIFGTSKLHDGVDFGAACGSPQYAIASGTVAASYFDSGGGNMVTINHGLLGGSSFVSEHLHLQSANVFAGQSVSRGDLIGWTGTTGSSTGCHLHLTLYKDGSTVDPLAYL